MKAFNHSPVLKCMPATIALPFEVHTFANTDEVTAYLYGQPHSHDYYKIVWVVSGSGRYCIDMQYCSIENNSVFCIKPGQMHRFVAQENMEGFILSFTESFLNIGELEFDLTCQANLFQLFSTTNGIAIKEEVLDDMREIIGKMRKEFDNLYLFKTEIIKRYLKIFLIYLTRQFEDNVEAITQTRNLEIVQSFMKLLEKNFREKKMVAEYGAGLCVTPNYLNVIIKKMTGHPAGHQIRLRVVLEAKRMALYSDMSMKEIAYALGFLDGAHFSKFFKAVTGRNFSDFKKEKIAISMAS